MSISSDETCSFIKDKSHLLYLWPPRTTSLYHHIKTLILQETASRHAFKVESIAPSHQATIAPSWPLNTPETMKSITVAALLAYAYAAVAAPLAGSEAQLSTFKPRSLHARLTDCVTDCEKTGATQFQCFFVFDEEDKDECSRLVEKVQTTAGSAKTTACNGLCNVLDDDWSACFITSKVSVPYTEYSVEYQFPLLQISLCSVNVVPMEPQSLLYSTARCINRANAWRFFFHHRFLKFESKKWPKQQTANSEPT